MTEETSSTLMFPYRAQRATERFDYYENEMHNSQAVPLAVSTGSGFRPTCLLHQRNNKLWMI